MCYITCNFWRKGRTGKKTKQHISKILSQSFPHNRISLFAGTRTRHNKIRKSLGQTWCSLWSSFMCWDLSWVLWGHLNCLSGYTNKVHGISERYWITNANISPGLNNTLSSSWNWSLNWDHGSQLASSRGMLCHWTRTRIGESIEDESRFQSIMAVGSRTGWLSWISDGNWRGEEGRGPLWGRNKQTWNTLCIFVVVGNAKS